MRALSAAERRRRLRLDRMAAVGLAVITCLGLTGLIAVRAAEAEPPAPAPDPGGLDEYAEQLTSEAARLAAYREELRQVAEQLARGEEVDTRTVERIAAETRPPGAPTGPSALERDTATYSS